MIWYYRLLAITMTFHAFVCTVDLCSQPNTQIYEKSRRDNVVAEKNVVCYVGALQQTKSQHFSHGYLSASQHVWYDSFTCTETLTSSDLSACWHALSVSVPSIQTLGLGGTSIYLYSVFIYIYSICMYIFTLNSMYIYICMCIYIYVCVYIYIYIFTVVPYISYSYCICLNIFIVN